MENQSGKRKRNRKRKRKKAGERERVSERLYENMKLRYRKEKRWRRGWGLDGKEGRRDSSWGLSLYNKAGKRKSHLVGVTTNESSLATSKFVRVLERIRHPSALKYEPGCKGRDRESEREKRSILKNETKLAKEGDFRTAGKEVVTDKKKYIHESQNARSAGKPGKKTVLPSFSPSAVGVGVCVCAQASLCLLQFLCVGVGSFVFRLLFTCHDIHVIVITVRRVIPLCWIPRKPIFFVNVSIERIGMVPM